MNKQSKFFMVFTIAVALVMGPAAMAAEEKPGAHLVITKKDGTQVAGELICVKREFISVMDAGSGINVDLKEIGVIEVKPRSKGGKAATGLLIGLISGFVIGFVVTDGMRRGSGPKSGWFDLDLRGCGGIIGAPLGGIVGLLAGIGTAADKRYKLEGQQLITITAILAKLDKQSRFPSTETERIALLGMK